MKPSQLRARIATSPRVLSVAAAAMQRLARDMLGIELSSDDARQLARTGDLESVLRDLRDRRGVRRSYLSPEEDLSLAVQEVSLRQAGVAEAEIGELVSRRVGKAKSLRESRRLAQSHASDLEGLIRRYENESPKFRKFLRQVEQLRAKRAMTLKMTISDEARQRRAIDELSRLIKGHIDEALATLGTQVPLENPSEKVAVELDDRLGRRRCTTGRIAPTPGFDLIEASLSMGAVFGSARLSHRIRRPCRNCKRTSHIRKRSHAHGDGVSVHMHPRCHCTDRSPVMKPARLPMRCPAPVATLPPRRRSRSGTFSMPRSETLSVPIDTVGRHTPRAPG